MGKYSGLASASLMFNVIAFFSLVYHIYQTKNTSSFNYLYLFGNIVAQLMLIVYGILNKAPEIYIPTLLLLGGLLFILFVKATN